jgi:hypothetical protein
MSQIAAFVNDWKPSLTGSGKKKPTAGGNSSPFSETDGVIYDLARPKPIF